MSDTVKAVTARERFEQLLEPVLRIAYGMAVHMSGSREDGENLVQDAALRAYRSFHTFQEGTNFKAWFLRILTNAYFEERRKKQRRPEVLCGNDAPDLYLMTQAAQSEGLGDDPAREILSQVETGEITDALQTLPPEYRLVCVLYFVQELSYQEIADTVGVPVGTVRSRLHRGRRILQKALWDIALSKGLVRPRAD